MPAESGVWTTVPNFPAIVGWMPHLPERYSTIRYRFDEKDHRLSKPGLQGHITKYAPRYGPVYERLPGLCFPCQFYRYPKASDPPETVPQADPAILRSTLQNLQH